MTNQTRTEPLDRLAEIRTALERQLPVKDTPSQSEGGVDVTLAVHFGTRANLIDSILGAIQPSLIAEAREAARLRTALEAIIDLGVYYPATNGERKARAIALDALHSQDCPARTGLGECHCDDIAALVKP